MNNRVMCKLTSLPANPTTRHVVVAGAGPAGILAAINTLRRNKGTNSDVSYRVTLIDANQDYGKLSPTDLKRHRSWMIGLASHGLEAIRDVPGLYEKYVSEIGIRLTSASIHIGAKEVRQEVDDPDKMEGFIVDRNFIVASMARYLNDEFLSDVSFNSMYDTKILYVDAEKSRVLVRRDNGNDEYVSYDVLLGCDGVRSVVRNALMQDDRDFAFSIDDIFADFKAVHIERPKSVDPSSMHLLPAVVPQANGIALPETGDKINLSIGFYKNKTIPEEMASDDAKVVAKYMRENFKAFELVDYDDFANQWVKQRWNTTGQVHCNFYHSTRLNIAIMGDAAHATSPSVGMGMNTALADALCFNRLLDEYKDDIKVVLNEYSNERVKEGNALTDLSFYLFSLCGSQALKYVIYSVLRSYLSKWFPKLVLEDPQAVIGRKGVKLSQVYDMATQIGILQDIRSKNDYLRREYFEKRSGLMTHERSVWGGTLKKAGVLLMVISAVIYFNRC
eukprot:CAMPEP_0172487430 /NCGR_PEP_ID=MMETSP1066-20121228/16529_1 /TAXON_ID=671091 /ORGANISM="Coscinodiscus wailesii, Strain CCMP2513" /LENGTH=503 /DNA_ID=CAMNT_0013254047 /DNA_START=27 /DNA_END=1538 /DNA_ORIENTATION=+